MKDYTKPTLFERINFWLFDVFDAVDDWQTNANDAVDNAFDKVENYVDRFVDKKYCDICGSKFKLFSKRRVNDGIICKSCIKKLSPFFVDYRKNSVADIKEHLAYREANKAAVSSFHVTRTLSADDIKILVDEDVGKFIITSVRKWQDENPDVFDCSQVTGCKSDIDESKKEIYRKTKDGNRESYDPPRYEYHYDYRMIIYINCPWVNEIRLKIASGTIEEYGSAKYPEAERQAQEIRNALMRRSGVKLGELRMYL